MLSTRWSWAKPRRQKSKLLEMLQNCLESRAAPDLFPELGRHQACLEAQEMPIVAGPRVTLSLGSGVWKQADSPPLVK